MAPTEVKRIVDRQGRLCVEEHLLDGQLHGLSRRWGANGALWFEAEYERGVPKWGCYWDDEGREIRRYELENGTGIEIESIDPPLGGHEVPWINGRRHGIACSREPDGRVRAYHFWVDDKHVDCIEYLTASATDPTLPKWEPPHAEQSFEAEVEAILARDNTHEARQWLDGDTERSLGAGMTTGRASKIVNELYEAGAKRVFVFDVDEDTQNSGRLLVELPKRSSVRKAILAWCNKWGAKKGFEPEEDTGQLYTIVILD